MFGEFLETFKQQFVNAVNIRNPTVMLGTIAGVAIAIGTVGTAGRLVKKSTQKALEGDAKGAINGVTDLPADWIESQLQILDAISPLSKKKKSSRRDRLTTKQKIDRAAKKSRGLK